MKRPGFINGVLLALLLALAGGAAFAALAAVFAGGPVLQLVVTGLAGAYVCYLLSRSGERAGRVAAFAAWLVGALVGWLVAPNLAVLLCGHVILIWLLRALYYHRGVLPALADLGLSAAALASAVWAAQQSGSVFMAVWCFFLVQALFVAIPPSFAPAADSRMPARSDAFQRAYGVAEAAARRLAKQR